MSRSVLRREAPRTKGGPRISKPGILHRAFLLQELAVQYVLGRVRDKRDLDLSQTRPATWCVATLFTLLDLCVSSLSTGHAKLLCIVPIVKGDPRRESDVACRDMKTAPPPMSKVLWAGRLTRRANESAALAKEATTSAEYMYMCICVYIYIYTYTYTYTYMYMVSTGMYRYVQVCM